MSQPAPNRQVNAPCIACGYDLRNDPVGICPECGVTPDDRERMKAAVMRKMTGTQVGFMVAGLILAPPILAGMFLMIACVIIVIVLAWD